MEQSSNWILLEIIIRSTSTMARYELRYSARTRANATRLWGAIFFFLFFFSFSFRIMDRRRRPSFPRPSSLFRARRLIKLNRHDISKTRRRIKFDSHEDDTLASRQVYRYFLFACCNIRFYWNILMLIRYLSSLLGFIQTFNLILNSGRHLRVKKDIEDAIWSNILNRKKNMFKMCSDVSPKYILEKSYYMCVNLFHL